MVHRAHHGGPWRRHGHTVATPWCIGPAMESPWSRNEPAMDAPLDSAWGHNGDAKYTSDLQYTHHGGAMETLWCIQPTIETP